MDTRPLEDFSGEELAAIASIWKRETRELQTSFRGFSMMPTIPPGTALTIECGDAVTLGDVIFFLHRGQPVVHRLVRLSPQSMLTRGDGNPIPDLPVSRDALIGRVTRVANSGVPRHIETRPQSISRRIAATALAFGSAPARLMLQLMWRVWRTITRSLAAWKLYGMAGFLARVCSHTIGRIVDIDVIYTGRFSPSTFTPVPGYRYQRVRIGSREFADAAHMLGVDPAKRANHEAFVAFDERDGSMAACTFAEAPGGPRAFNRGVVADPRHRGKSLTGNLLLYQASALADDGVKEVEYHVNATNRGARRMYRKIGAREIDRWIILILLRKYRLSWRSVFATARIPNPS